MTPNSNPKKWAPHVTIPHTCGGRKRGTPPEKITAWALDVNAACDRWLRDNGHPTKFDNNILFGQRLPLKLTPKK